MKKFKLSVAVFASGLMAYSPVVQASTLSAAQKQAVNTNVRNVTNYTYGDLLRNYGHMLEPASQKQVQNWIKQFGSRKLPKVEAQVVKDKKGNETVKLVLNDLGQSYTVTVDPTSKGQIDINGLKVSFYELFNLSGLIKKMAVKDKAYLQAEKELSTDRSPASVKLSGLTYAQFAKMKPIERVETLSLMRLAAQSAQKVLATSPETKKTASIEPSFILNPLIASTIAWAEVKKDTSCVVAGNISTYQFDRPGHLACDPFTAEAKAFNEQCGGGTKVACNPLVHGFDSAGKPFCLESANQPDFTNFATKSCNAASPLDGDEKSDARRASYRRILESYAVGTGKGTKDKVAACFNEKNEILRNTDCQAMFEQHRDQFFKLMAQAKDVCGTVADQVKSSEKTKDQPLACSELLGRDLWLTLHTQGSPIAAGPDLYTETCEKNGGNYGYDPECRMNVCKCPNGQLAKEGDGGYSCPKEDQLPPVVDAGPGVPGTHQKEKDKKICEGGWMVACAGIPLLLLAWWWHKDGNAKTPTVTNPPNPCGIGGCGPWWPPVIIPSEGNNGQTGSTDNGGVRAPQPQPNKAGGTK